VVLHKRIDYFPEQHGELSHICEEEFRNKNGTGINGNG